MIHFYTCENMIEAQRILDSLVEKHIRAKIVNSSLGGITGEVPFTETWPKIWLLDPEDEPLARKILDELKQLQKKSYHDQYCPKCKEKNPGNFLSCWNCGADLD